MMDAANRRTGYRHFRHPPEWKWAIALLLLAAAVFLTFWKRPARPVKVELLPFTDSPPAWDGAYPYLILSSTDSRAEQIELDSAIRLVKPTVRHDSPLNEFLVDLHSGMFVLRQTDLFIPDVTPLSLTRTYRVWDCCARAFGMGMNHPYDICPTGTRFPYTYMDLNLEDGRQIHFDRISKGTGYADAVFRHQETSSEFYGAQIAWNGDGWTLNFRDGRRFQFPEAYLAKTYAQGAAIEMDDLNGRHIQLKRDQRRNLEQLISPSGHSIRFKYDAADRVTEAASDSGDLRSYSYDSSGHLETVADATRVLFRFEYAPLLHYPGYDSYLLMTVFDGSGNALLRNNYTRGGQIAEQRLGNGETYRYSYIFVKDEIVETIVNDSTGERKFFFQHGVLTREE